MITPKIFWVRFASQYHETEEFLCTTLEGAFVYLHSPERSANPSEPESEREIILETIKLAWESGIATHWTGTNKYTAEVSSAQVW